MDQRDIAVSFLQMCARGDVRDAFLRHVADDFVHHNAWFAADRESLLAAMEHSAAAEPNKSFEVRQVIEEDDRVVVMSHLKRAGVGLEYATVHILRFHAGQIVEAWDIAQEVPEHSPNALGMF